MWLWKAAVCAKHVVLVQCMRTRGHSNMHSCAVNTPCVQAGVVETLLFYCISLSLSVYCVNKKNLQNSSCSVSNAIRGNYNIGHKVKLLFYANSISWPAALSLPNSPMFVKLRCKEWCNVLLLMPLYLKVVLSLPSIFFHQASSSDIYCRYCSRRPPIQNKLHVTKWKIAHQHIHQKNVVQAQPKIRLLGFMCIFGCICQWICLCIYLCSAHVYL